MKNNMIHFQIKDVFPKLSVSVLNYILARKNKQHLAEIGITMIHVPSEKTSLLYD